MGKMQCIRCKSKAVMEDVGLCLKCGFRNKPITDTQEEARKQQEQQAAQQKAAMQAAQDAVMQDLQSVLQLAREGDPAAATRKLQEINPDGKDLQLEKMKTQAELWQLKGVPEMQLKVLEELAAELPFGQEHLEFYYDMACLYQEGGSGAKAFWIFNDFVENSYDWYRDDILSRWQQLKQTEDVQSPAGPAGNSCRILVGAMDQTVESVRAWIDAATAQQNYFTESILLNENSYQDTERVERSFSNNFELEAVVEAHTLQLQSSGYTRYRVKHGQVALDRDNSPGDSSTEVLIIQPAAACPLSLDFGTINLAARCMPEGRSAVSIAFYEFFTPRSPREFPGQQPDLRDFNDQVYQTVSRIHQNNTERAVLLRSHRELLVKSITAFLEQQDRADGDLLF